MRNFSVREFKLGVEQGALFPDGIRKIVFASREQIGRDEDRLTSFRLTFTQIEVELFPSAIVLRDVAGQIIRLNAVKNIRVSKARSGDVFRIEISCGNLLFPDEAKKYTLLVF